MHPNRVQRYKKFLIYTNFSIFFFFFYYLCCYVGLGHGRFSRSPGAPSPITLRCAISSPPRVRRCSRISASAPPRPRGAQCRSSDEIILCLPSFFIASMRARFCALSSLLIYYSQSNNIFIIKSFFFNFL